MAFSKHLTAKRLTIAVASPERFFRSMMSEILSNFGYSKIMMAETPRALLELVSQQEIDMIIMDEDMPILSPAEVSRMVRSGNEGAKSPHTVLVVFKATRSVVDAARSSGFDALIVKPVIPLRLARTIQQLQNLGAAA